MWNIALQRIGSACRYHDEGTDMQKTQTIAAVDGCWIMRRNTHAITSWENECRRMEITV